MKSESNLKKNKENQRRLILFLPRREDTGQNLVSSCKLSENPRKEKAAVEVHIFIKCMEIQLSNWSHTNEN